MIPHGTKLRRGRNKKSLAGGNSLANTYYMAYVGPVIEAAGPSFVWDKAADQRLIDAIAAVGGRPLCGQWGIFAKEYFPRHTGSEIYSRYHLLKPTLVALHGVSTSSCDSDDHKTLNAVQDKLNRRSSVTKEADFLLALENLGIKISLITGDGNCLFRATAFLLFGDPERHPEVRANCVAFIAENQTWLEHKIDMDFHKYLGVISNDREWGGHIEIKAICGCYNVDAKILRPKSFDSKTKCEVVFTKIGWRHTKEEKAETRPELLLT